MVQVSNNFFPIPSVIGNICNHSSSIKSFFNKVCTRLPLPYTCKSGPSCCLSFLISATVSPFKKTVGFQSCEVSVFEATYFVTSLIPGHCSACCGQYDANISNVFRPSNKSNGLLICSPITFPKNSSKYGAVQPPYVKPPLVSSSGPPGACMTPSSVIKVTTMILRI